MITASEKSHISRLAQAAAKQTGTEQLLILLATEDGLLDFCRHLTGTEGLSSPPGRALAEACRTNGCSLEALLSHIREVLRALDVTDQPKGDAYNVLGLPEAAPLAEVKKAFRRLSLQYHPDHAGQEMSSQTFVAIHAAYKKILADHENVPAVTLTPWKHLESAESKKSADHRKFFGTMLGVVIVLVLLTFVLVDRKNRAFLYQQPSHKEQTIVQATEKNRIQASPKSTAEAPQVPAPETVQKSPSPVRVVVHQAQSVPQPKPPVLSIPEKKEPATTPVAVAKVEESPLPAIQPQKKKTTKIDLAQPTVMKVDQPVVADIEPPKVIKHVHPIATKAEAPKKMVKQSGQAAVVTTKPVTPKALPVAEVPAPSDLIRQDADQQTVQPKTPIQMTQQLQGVVERFTQGYEGRDLEAFYRLFTPQATENNQPIESLRENYEAVFHETRDIRLKIRNINWQETAQDYHVTGSFVVTYSYQTGADKAYHGDIILAVLREEDQFKISRFDYVIK